MKEYTARVLEGESLRQIALSLTAAAGYKTVKGVPWSGTVVSAVLRSPRTAGMREVGLEGAWEPILDRALWERVVATLAHTPVGRRPQPPARRLPLVWSLRQPHVLEHEVHEGRRPAAAPVPVPHRPRRLRANGGVGAGRRVRGRHRHGRLRGADVGAVQAETEAAVATLVAAGTRSCWRSWPPTWAPGASPDPEWLRARAEVEERLQANRGRLGQASPRPAGGRGRPRRRLEHVDLRAERAAIALVVEHVIVHEATNKGELRPQPT